MSKRLISFILNSTTITTWLSFATKALSFVIVLPLLLSRYAAVDIAIWQLFLTLWSFQIVFDAGFGSAFIRVIAYGTVGAKQFDFINQKINENISSGKQDYTFINAVFTVMKSFYLILFIACLIILLTAGTYFFQKPILASTFPEMGWRNWYFFVVTYPIIIWGNIYVNFLIGNHHIPQLRIGETVFNLLSIITVVLLSLLNCNIHVLIFSYQCWFVLGVLRNFFISKYYLGYIYKYEVEKETIKTVRSLVIGNAYKSGIGIVMSQGVAQGTSILYAQVTSPALLASYLIGLNIANSIKSFAQAPFYSKLPLFASLMGKGQKEELAAISALNMRRVYLIFLFFFFIITLSHEYVFNLIGSKVNFPDLKIWFLIGFGIMIERFGAMHLQMYSTTNHIIWHWLNGLTGIILLISFIITLPLIGLYAFPVSYVIAYLCFYSWYIPKLSYKVLKTTFWKFEANVFVPVIVFFILFATYYLI